MSRTPTPPDADRDPWLSQALRHAPDADVAPPPSLSELILREAQAKAKPAAAPAPRPAAPFWSRVWDWTARPAVGAGAASVMLASLVGVMMWNRPLEEMSPRPAVEMASKAPAAPAPASAAQPAPEEAPKAAQAPTSGSAAAAPPPSSTEVAADVAQRRERVADSRSADAIKAGKAAEDAVGLLARKREAVEKKRADESERRAEPEKLAAGLKDDRARTTPKPAPDALAKAARTAEAMSPAPPAVEPAATAGAAAPVAAMPAAPTAPAPMPAPVPAPAPASPTQSPSPSQTQAAQANANRAITVFGAQDAKVQRQAPVASVPAASRFAAGGLAVAPAERSFINLRASLAAESAPWTWSRDGGAPHPIDDSLAAFLADVDSVAASRWQTGGALAEASGRTTSADAASTRDKQIPPPGVRLLLNGQPMHLLRLEGHVLHWERLGADPASATVTLTDAELQTVRHALDKLAP